ncbi:CheR family methyltransferase, partial [Pyxidicoccus sp. 3LFB2]
MLPELRERLGPGHPLRVWSAACSSGEEPYSLAVLLQAEGWGEHASVYATDVSRGALARARQATYGEWSLRGPWADRIRPYLRPEGRRYALAPEVQQRVRFGYLNLALDTWPSADSGIWRLDVIFCRNVLIYFNRATIEAVARRLHDALAEGGYLFTGPSDPPLGDLAPLEPVLTPWGVLYRRPLPGASVSVPPPPFSATYEARAPSESMLTGRGAATPAGTSPVLPPFQERGASDAADSRATPVPPSSARGAPRAPDAEALAAARLALAQGNW